MIESLSKGTKAAVPFMGVEALDLLFRLGVLDTEQLRVLLPGPEEGEIFGERRVQRLLAALRTGNLILSARRKYRFFEVGATQQYKMVHQLSEAGLRFVADRQDLYHRVAASLYKQVCREPIMEHALLRNEYYADLMRALRQEHRRGEGWLSNLEIETMCAESGMTPMELSKGGKGGRRYLNPDGMLSFTLKGDPSYYRAFFIESDTGSEDMPWKIAAKADQYAQRWSDLLRAGEAPERIPNVLFISPSVKRTRWVREVFRERGLNPESEFYKARNLFRGNQLSLPARAIFTNLAWLARRGSLDEAYWSLASRDVGSLLS